MKPSADPEIERILREPEGDTPRDHLELLSVLSNRITPAGIVCPPPTLGTYALLSCIRSPFLALPRVRTGREDTAAALFILSSPKQAAELLRQRAVCEERFSRAADGGSGTGPVPIGKTLAKERKFRKEWNRQLRRFERMLGSDERVLEQAADELFLYLDPGIGFSMLPEADDNDPQAFNLETVARIAAGLAEVIPGTATERLLWQIPMVEIGMLLVQAARKHGVRGISRDEKTRRLWQRFEQLQNPGENMSRLPDRRRSRKEETARRHCSLIRSAADLHLFSAGRGKKTRNEPAIPAAQQKPVMEKSAVHKNMNSQKSSISTREKINVQSSSVHKNTNSQKSSISTREKMDSQKSSISMREKINAQSSSVHENTDSQKSSISTREKINAQSSSVQKTTAGRNSFTQEKTNSRSSFISVRGETTVRDSRTQKLSRKITERKDCVGNNGGQAVKGWTGRADFAAVIPVSAGPLQTLTNSVIHIENILKHQLPDSVV